DAVELGAARHAAHRVDRFARIPEGSPSADRVEMLHGKAERVHDRMAARAGRVCPMRGEPLAHRELGPFAVGLDETRYVRRRGRRRRAEQILENPLAANDGRSPVRIGSHRENAAVAENAAAGIVGAELDALKAGSLDAGDTVMLCYAPVE